MRAPHPLTRAGALADYEGVDMTEASWSALDAWRRADSGDEATMSAEGVSYLAAQIDGVRHIAPLGSVAPAGVEVETVPPSEEMLARMRTLGRQSTR